MLLLNTPVGTRAKTRRSLLGSLRKLLKGYVLAIVAAAVVALLVRAYVVEAFRIPIDFMAPTLIPGDHIFVNKLAYRSGGDKSRPERGDVVIFSFPSEPNKDYIKRVIGIEDDVIEIQDGKVWVNGSVITSDNNEEILGSRHYSVQWDGASPESRKMVSVKVPKGHLFVLGDNRAKGQDSRAWGFLSEQYIKGRAEVVWLSTGVDGQALGVRWSRILKKVL